MKIVLLDKIDDLGEAGEVVEVADGYARNYLIPKGLAELATTESLARWEEQKAKREREAQKAREEAQELASAIDGLEVEIAAKAGESGKLFGSVTSAQVAEAVQEKSGVDLDRKYIELEDPLRELGEFAVEVSLYEDVSATVTVHVIGEEDD